MQEIFCQIHNLNIKIYSREEEGLLIDDNTLDTVIFYNENNKKYLKRFTPEKCDENCETIKFLLNLI